MKRETRNTVGEVELRAAGDGPPKIVGYAAKFYRVGDAGTEYALFRNAKERIMPGAFDEAVATDDVRGLFNHEPSMLLGRTRSGTLKLSVDDVGLRYEIEPASTSVYQDVAEHLRRGDVDGSSFQFSVPDGGEQWRMEGNVEVRELRKVNLYDVGPVVFPAYAAATSGIRSEADCADALASRDAWKEADKVRREKTLREATMRELDI